MTTDIFQDLPGSCPQNAPLAYTIKEASRLSTIGRTRLYQLIAEGKLEAKKIGKRTVIPAVSLRRLIEQGA